MIQCNLISCTCQGVYLGVQWEAWHTRSRVEEVQVLVFVLIIVFVV
jgi:hypothetical protein